MKKKIVLSFLIGFCFSFFVKAQKQGNIWYFGQNAGIDFNSCQPIVLTDGNNPGFEGCATICDTNGQLLFYTNSDTVWDRTHNMMANGYLIGSGGTLSQVIIVPMPQSDSIYYVITTVIQASVGLLEYHIIDMSLNSGYGAVISKNNVLFNSSQITEQITATKHANGNDIWLITHEYGNNHFLSYLLTASGINTIPVISSVGLAQIPVTSNFNARGEIKVSPDGTKLAFNGNGIAYTPNSDLLEIFDFDNSTGTVYNPIYLPYERGEFGLSFSPDNSKLYSATWKCFGFVPADSNMLSQFDLSSNDSLTIVNSKQRIYTTASTFGAFGSIKIGPDGKVYVAVSASDYVGVINEPNLPGLLCNYNHNGLYLQGKICQMGLNNYIEYNNYCDSTTSIKKQYSSSNTIDIFPNPTTGTIQLTFNTKHNAQLHCEIINIMGEKVYEDPLRTPNYRLQTTLDVSFLAKGIYLVRIGDGARFENKKLVIE